VTTRLDDEKIEALHAWGDRLAEDDREDVRAAGRAILVLVEEVTSLRHALSQESVIPLALSAQDSDAELQSGLRARLSQFARRGSQVSGSS
jgi:hypothetical protein